MVPTHGAGGASCSALVLNQQTAQPIVASAWSKAEGVTGTIDSDDALYFNDPTLS